MTKVAERTEIKNAVNSYCKAKAMSKEDLALQIGISGATLSDIANDKWDAINERMWQKVWNYVRPFNIPQLYKTADFQAAENLCLKAKANHYMAGLLADTGMGKTTALKSIARQENVFYIYYDTNMRPNHFFYELGKLLGYEYEAKMYDMVNKVCDTLNTLDSPLILIDEAGKLTDPMLMAIHVLRDKTIHNCGIVLGGMPYFKHNLIKKANKQKIGISEFYRRIMIWNELGGLSNDEIEFICQNNGITDKKEIARFRPYRKFGDLANELLLYKTLNN